MLTKLWNSIPVTVRWVLACLLALAVGLGVGRFTHPTPTEQQTTTTTTTSGTSSSTNTSTTTSGSQSHVEYVYVNQATLRQDQNSDCTEDFSPETGKLLRRHCVTKTTTEGGSTTTSGGTASTNTGSTTTTSGTTNSTTNTTTTTSTTTKYEPESRWGLSLIADSTVFQNGRPGFEYTYGAALELKLIGPVSTSVAVYTDRSASLSLNLDLTKRLVVSADLNLDFDSLRPAYGGSLSYKVIGPVWVGAWVDGGAPGGPRGGVNVSLTVR